MILEGTSWTLRAGLAALLVYAGITKLLDVHGFALDIANYRAVPAALVPLMAVTLPGIEIICGASLLLSKTLRAAAWLTTALLGVFTLAVAQALARGISIECGCFGSARDPVTEATLLRDLALVGCAGLLLWLTRTPPTAESV